MKDFGGIHATNHSFSTKMHLNSSEVVKWEVPILFIFYNFIYLCFNFIWPHHAACGILVPWPGIKPMFPVLGVWSLNHWTTREVARGSYIKARGNVWDLGRSPSPALTVSEVGQVACLLFLFFQPISKPDHDRTASPRYWQCCMGTEWKGSCWWERHPGFQDPSLQSVL